MCVCVCASVKIMSVASFAKAVMKLLGLDMGQPRLPVTPITDEVLELLRNDLEEIGFFEWALPQ